mgnify:CR=1 FL=1
MAERRTSRNSKGSDWDADEVTSLGELLVFSNHLWRTLIHQDLFPLKVKQVGVQDRYQPLVTLVPPKINTISLHIR